MEILTHFVYVFVLKHHYYELILFYAKFALMTDDRHELDNTLDVDTSPAVVAYTVVVVNIHNRPYCLAKRTQVTLVRSLFEENYYK